MADTPTNPDSPTYLLNKRRIGESYDIGVADSNYAQTLEDQRSARAQKANDYTWARAKDNQAFSAGNKGFSNKGAAYTRSLQDYTQGRTGAYADALASHQAKMQEINRNRAELLRTRDYGLQDNDLSETERKQKLAADLRSVGGGGATGATPPGQIPANMGGTGTSTDPYLGVPFAQGDNGETLNDPNGNPIYANNQQAIDAARQAPRTRQPGDGLIYVNGQYVEDPNWQG